MIVLNPETTQISNAMHVVKWDTQVLAALMITPELPNRRRSQRQVVERPVGILLLTKPLLTLVDGMPQPRAHLVAGKGARRALWNDMLVWKTEEMGCCM